MVGDHVVSGTSLCDHETEWGATTSGRDCLEQRLNQNQRENNVVRLLGDRACGVQRERLERDPTTR